MFLEMLNENQKRAFLVLASKVTMADGEDSAEEMEALRTLGREMGITAEIDIKASLGDIDVAPFDTHKSRVIAALELLRLAYADEYVHEAEVVTVRDICNAMGFPEEWLSTMGEWATRIKQVDAPSVDGEMAEYRDALIEHAHQMMEV